MTEAENKISDADYLLSLIDETFANVPQIKAHHDRMRNIAATLCRYAAPSKEAASITSVAPPQQPPQVVLEWKTPPAPWRLLLKAVIELLCAVEDRHDSAAYPMKYSVPYGAVNNLRASLGVVSPTAAPAKKYPLPDDLYPDSKDWVAGCYAERVEWLHSMYESSKDLIASLEAQFLSAQHDLKATREPETAHKPLMLCQRIALFHTACAVTYTNWGDFDTGIRAAEADHGIGTKS